MNTISRTLGLGAAFLAIAGAPLLSNAQEKKAPVQEKKAVTAKKEAGTDSKKSSSGVVEIAEGKDGKFRFSVRDGENKYVGGSGPIGFETKEAAAKAVQSLKDTLSNARITYPAKKAESK